MSDIFVTIVVSITVFLIMNCLCNNTKAIEGMTDNLEALSNLSSMYANKKLIIDDLEVNGNIRLSGTLGKLDSSPVDIVRGANLGNAYVGSWMGDLTAGAFSHKDKNTLGGYSIIQKSNGKTFINSSDNVNIRKHNDQNSGGANIGNAYVGSWGSNTAYGAFAHKNNNNTKCAMVQPSGGGTIINSSGKVSLRQNNNRVKGKLELSVLSPIPENQKIGQDHKIYGQKVDAADMGSGDFLFGTVDNGEPAGMILLKEDVDRNVVWHYLNSSRKGYK